MSTGEKPRSHFLLNVSLDVAPECEALLNAVYHEEHVPLLLDVPGVVSIQRYRRQALKLALGDSIHEFIFKDEPRYTTLYEIESPEILISTDWATAVNAGRWAREVRPFTKNRRHTLYELIELRRK